MLVLKGRAVESGGAYRPLVEAFARVGSICSETELAAVRPIPARVLPGWISDHDVLAPMADPAAVLAEALILLGRAMSADGAVLLIDDVHWADDDTVSVLSYLADSLDQLPLALIMDSSQRTAASRTAGTAERCTIDPPAAAQPAPGL